MSDTERDVEEALEEFDAVIRRAEKVGDRFSTVNVRHLETIRDEIRDLRSRLEEVETSRKCWRSAYDEAKRIARANRRRADRLEEALEQMTDPPLVLKGDDAREVASWFVERARSALDSGEAVGEACKWGINLAEELLEGIRAGRIEAPEMADHKVDFLYGKVCDAYDRLREHLPDGEDDGAGRVSRSIYRVRPSEHPDKIREHRDTDEPEGDEAGFIGDMRETVEKAASKAPEWAKRRVENMDIQESEIVEPISRGVARTSCIHHDGVGDVGLNEAVGKMTTTGWPLCQACVNAVLRVERGLHDDPPTDEPVSGEGDGPDTSAAGGDYERCPSVHEVGSQCDRRAGHDGHHEGYFGKKWTDQSGARPATHADARSDGDALAEKLEARAEYVEKAGQGAAADTMRAAADQLRRSPTSIDWSTIGVDYSQAQVEADGYDFASWEQGFEDAVKVIRRRLSDRHEEDERDG